MAEVNINTEIESIPKTLQSSLSSLSHNINTTIESIPKTLQSSLSSLSHNLDAEIFPISILQAISPSAKIQQLPNGNYLITITDKNGTTKQEIQNVNSFVEVRTTKEWNDDLYFQSKKGIFYIYNDYKTQEKDGKIIKIPGIKIGDGLAYVIDLPFINNDIEYKIDQHIANLEVHITPEERQFWNNKVTCYPDSVDNENLIFTKF